MSEARKTRRARSLYPPTHYYEHEYEETSLFCPQCGKRAVWSETGAGDYYCGPTHVCLECSNSFTIQESGEGELSRSIAEQLRTETLAETDLWDGSKPKPEDAIGGRFYGQLLERSLPRLVHLGKPSPVSRIIRFRRMEPLDKP
jgi:hypothetical protein